MKIVWFTLAGLAGGILGGMGMGGGTVLIPILTILLKVPQHTAQAVNLIAFIPMSFCALAFHIKNKLVDFKDILWLIVPAAITAAGGSLLAKVIGGKTLARVFGVFLIALSFFQFKGSKRRPDPEKTGGPPVLLTPPGRPLGWKVPPPGKKKGETGEEDEKKS